MVCTVQIPKNMDGKGAEKKKDIDAARTPQLGQTAQISPDTNRKETEGDRDHELFENNLVWSVLHRFSISQNKAGEDGDCKILENTIMYLHCTDPRPQKQKKSRERSMAPIP